VYVVRCKGDIRVFMLVVHPGSTCELLGCLCLGHQAARVLRCAGGVTSSESGRACESGVRGIAGAEYLRLHSAPLQLLVSKTTYHKSALRLSIGTCSKDRTIRHTRETCPVKAS
jgi:hypothetical protein